MIYRLSMKRSEIVKKTPIQLARIKKKFSQEQTARLLEVSLRHYQKIEYSEVLPNIYTGLKLALLLETNPYELFRTESRHLENKNIR